LVALSGYNIAIIVVCSWLVFGSLFPRKYVFWVTGISVLFFVLMVGGAASVIRAAIMGFLALIARETGRPYHMRNSITCAAAGMAIFNPTILRWDLGFQLSFLSLCGITYISPRIFDFLGSKEGSFLNWKENAAATIGAQMAVVPLLALTFGSFSPLSIVANILILGLVPATMLLGFILSAIGLLIPSGAALLALPSHLILGYERFIIKFFAGISPAFPRSFTWFVLIGLAYAALLFAIYKPKQASLS
jgi:competence protein ComEC